LMKGINDMKPNKPYTRMTDKILFDSRVSSTQRNIYWVLCRHAFGNRNHSFPSQSKIAKMCGIRSDTVSTNIKALAEYGYITVMKQGKKELNVYEIAIFPVEEITTFVKSKESKLKESDSVEYQKRKHSPTAKTHARRAKPAAIGNSDFDSSQSHSEKQLCFQSKSPFDSSQSKAVQPNQDLEKTKSESNRSDLLRYAPQILTENLRNDFHSGCEPREIGLAEEETLKEVDTRSASGEDATADLVAASGLPSASTFGGMQEDKKPVEAAVSAPVQTKTQSDSEIQSILQKVKNAIPAVRDTIVEARAKPKVTEWHPRTEALRKALADENERKAAEDAALAQSLETGEIIDDPETITHLD
jgi:hypothetical protein